MTMIRIKKNPKRRVRNPDTGEKLADGVEYEVEDSPYWRRRIQSADVFEIRDAEPENPNQGADDPSMGNKDETSQSSGQDAEKGSEEKTDVAGKDEGNDPPQKETAASTADKPAPAKEQKKAASKPKGKK